MRTLAFELPLERIAAYCQDEPVVRLSLFGSVLRDDFSDRSDVDLLVDLAPGARVGLFKFLGMKSELEKIIGRTVDLRTADDLHPRFRDRVVREAEEIYARQDGR